MATKPYFPGYIVLVIMMLVSIITNSAIVPVINSPNTLQILNNTENGSGKSRNTGPLDTNAFRIAFAMGHPKPWDIWTINSDGSNLTNLTNNKSSSVYDMYRDPSLSPNGQNIIYGYNQFYIYDFSKTKVIKEINCGIANGGDWSPDSAVFATGDINHCSSRDAYDLVFVKSNGVVLSGLKFPHTEVINEVSSPDWAPDGKSVVYVAHINGDKYALLLTKFPSLVTSEIPLDGRYDLSLSVPSWSQDGKYIALTVTINNDHDYHTLVVNPSGVLVAEIATGNEKGMGDDVLWSPVNNELLFRCDKRSWMKICVMDFGTRKIKELGVSAYEAVWSPDGNKIVYSYGQQLWIINRDGSNKQLLLSDKGNIYELTTAVSPSASLNPRPVGIATPIASKAPGKLTTPNSQLTVVINNISYPARKICSDTYLSIIKVGDKARITEVPPISQRVRTGPGTGNSVIELVKPGESISIIGGPECTGGFIWWNVRTNSGMVGWTAEGDGADYWLIPYK